MPARSRSRASLTRRILQCARFQPAKDGPAIVDQLKVLAADLPRRVALQGGGERRLQLVGLRTGTGQARGRELAEAEIAFLALILAREAVAAAEARDASGRTLQDEVKLPLARTRRHRPVPQSRELPVSVLERRGGVA